MGIFTAPNNKTARDQWVKEKLEELPSGIKFLDAGCGPQPYKKHCSHVNYYAQDFAEYDGKGDQKGSQNKDWVYGSLNFECDITNIPVENNYFDAVLCTEVLEHVKDPLLAIKELSRITKPGGRIFLTAPVCSIPHQTPYYFYNGFSEYWYRELAKDNNLEMLSIDKNGNPFLYLQQEICRLDKKISSRALATITKIVSHGIVSPLLFCLSKMFNDLDYLHFGYHVVFSKK